MGFDSVRGWCAVVPLPQPATAATARPTTVTTATAAGRVSVLIVPHSMIVLSFAQAPAGEPAFALAAIALATMPRPIPPGGRAFCHPCRGPGSPLKETEGPAP